MFRISFKGLRNVVILTILVVASGIGGWWLGNKGYTLELSKYNKITVSRQLPPDKAALDFSLFWQVWDRLHASYFDSSKLVPQNMVYGAIKGMVEAIGDPYTVFLPPVQNKLVQEDLGGSFEGVGIQIGFKGTQLVVIAPLPDTPAEKAGVKAGDYILSIRDEKRGIDRSTVGITLPEAVEAIRGPKGTKVVLTLLREDKDEPFDIEIARGEIEVESVKVEFVGEGEEIAHINLLRFGAETESEWERAVTEVKAKDLKGVILDLRNNPGGYLDGSIYIASEFLSSGVVVRQEDAKGLKQELSVDRRGRLTDIPLVVLVDKGSASASEIVAGALRDAKRGKLVGETTFGKGTIQEPQKFPNGAGLHVTIAKWLTPSGTWVNEKGIEPDVEVKGDSNTEKDEQLEEAIKILQQMIFQ